MKEEESKPQKPDSQIGSIDPTRPQFSASVYMQPLELPETMKANGKLYIEAISLQRMIQQTAFAFDASLELNNILSAASGNAFDKTKSNAGSIPVCFGLHLLHVAAGFKPATKFDPNNPKHVEILTGMCIPIPENAEDENVQVVLSLKVAKPKSKPSAGEAEQTAKTDPAKMNDHLLAVVREEMAKIKQETAAKKLTPAPSVQPTNTANN